MSKIKNFFNKAAINRNVKIAAKPIVKYEQTVRAQMVMSLLDPKQNEFILDVGCGSGRDIVTLAQKKCRCIGFDVSKNMIEEARKELLKNNISDVELKIGDVINLDFSNEMFDKVFASEVLEHVPDCNKAVSEMSRVLKPGGALVITTPNRYSMYGFDRYVILGKMLKRKWPHPYDEWKTYSSLALAIKNNGLKIIRVYGICYIPGFILSYRLPKLLQRILVGVIKTVEPILSIVFSRNGYMLAIKAKKETGK